MKVAIAVATCSAIVLQPASAIAAQVVAGPIYEDIADCNGGTNYCNASFLPYPNLPGKYIRINYVGCTFNSLTPVSYVKIENIGGGISTRTQILDAPMKSGFFSFGQETNFVVTANSTRRPYLTAGNNGAGTQGNFLAGSCVISGEIFTP